MRPVFFFSRPVTILDCGASHTTLAVWRSGSGMRPKREKACAIPHSSGGGTETGWLQKTIATIPELAAATGARGEVTVLLPPHLVLMKMLQTPPVAPAKRDKIIRFECQQGIPYPLAEVAWDKIVTGENALGCHVLLAAAKLDSLEPLCSALIAVGLRPVLLAPSVQALVAGYRAMVDPLPKGPLLLVNLGGRSATLVLFEGGVWQARSLAFGVVETDNAKAMDEMAKRLAPEITRTLVHFGRPVGTEPVPRLLLTGEATRLPGLAATLAVLLKMPAECWALDGKIEAGSDEPAFLELAGAAVLARAKPGEAMNLLPPRLRQQAGRRVLRPWVAVAAGMAVGGIGLAWQMERQQLARLRSQNQATESELIALRTEAARVEAIRRDRAEKARRELAIASVTKARFAWAEFLAGLEREFPADGSAWLERLEPEPVAPPAVSIAGSTMTKVPVRLALTAVLANASDATENGQVSESLQRMGVILGKLAAVPGVAAVHEVVCEPPGRGQMRFRFVLKLKEGTLEP